jgi:hypothetical protein
VSAFADAVRSTTGLDQAHRPGLGALRRTDRHRIHCPEPRNLTGSVDLDSALSDSHPNDPRWDYGIALRVDRKSELVFWVEVHPASSSHIQQVLSKLSWIRDWLRSSAPLLNAFPRQFVWIASGRVAIPANSPQRKRLANAGIRFAGARFELSRSA